jgi:3-methyladenine DNA glycosylase AlkD
MSLRAVREAMRREADPERAKNLRRFFKTGPGDYGEGDRFHGLKVGQVRTIARRFRDLDLDVVAQLLDSPWHEERLLALVILVERFRRADEVTQKALHRFYLDHLDGVNNWDLVDLSAPTLMGAYLANRDRRILYRFAKSKDLWKKRIAVLSTFWFIRESDFDDALELAALLRDDPHDLIHKAVGWMLREIGNRDRAAEEQFLKQHCRYMPRTMLRYAIEKFPERLRRQYLNCPA